MKRTYRKNIVLEIDGKDVIEIAQAGKCYQRTPQGNKKITSAFDKTNKTIALRLLDGSDIILRSEGKNIICDTRSIKRLS